MVWGVSGVVGSSIVIFFGDQIQLTGLLIQPQESPAGTTRRLHIQVSLNKNGSMIIRLLIGVNFLSPKDLATLTLCHIFLGLR